MDAEDTEQLLLAERAVEWLIRLKTAGPTEHAEFHRWLTQSPLHVREALVATATHLLLAHLLRKDSIDPKALAIQAGKVHEIGNDDRASRESHAPPATPSVIERD